MSSRRTLKSRTEKVRRPPSSRPTRLSLRDAVVEAADPAERAELLSLKGEAYMIYQVMTPGPKGRRYLELCDNAWARLERRLSSEEQLGTGCDPRDPFAPRRAVPADRWKYAQVDFEKWTARIGDVDIIEIEVSSVGLRVLKSFRQVYWAGAKFKLSAGLFPIFLTLAEGAKDERTIEKAHDLKAKHFGMDADDGAVSLAIFRIKERMQRAGFDKATCDALILTEPGEYRLRVPAAEISIEV
jgi:hypothetical protein